MKVSVLIPVFNGERYLPECLDSILTQDFRDLEILISDDGSTDGSLEIIKNFGTRDSRIRWWKNTKNFGLTANSNICLKKARGEYIKFVHQDDELLSSSAIQKMVAAMEAHPNASLVSSQQRFTKTDSTHTWEPDIFPRASGCYNGRRTIITCLEQHINIVGAPTLTLFRQFQAQRGFDERFTLFMDYEMWFHLLEQGDYVYLDEPLATWRLHSGQTSHSEQTGEAHGRFDHEYLLLAETYYQKPWLQAAATQRMLFVQSHFLQRRYGRQAAGLIRKMQASIKLKTFLVYWLDRKFEKIKTWPDRKFKKIKRWINKTQDRFRQPAA